MVIWESAGAFRRSSGNVQSKRYNFLWQAQAKRLTVSWIRSCHTIPQALRTYPRSDQILAYHGLTHSSQTKVDGGSYHSGKNIGYEPLIHINPHCKQIPLPSLAILGMIFPQSPCHSEIPRSSRIGMKIHQENTTRPQKQQGRLRAIWIRLRAAGPLMRQLGTWSDREMNSYEFNQKIRLDWWKARINHSENIEKFQQKYGNQLRHCYHCCFKMFRPTSICGSLWIYVAKHGGRQQKSGWIRNVRKNLVTKLWTSETKSQTLSSKKGKTLEVFLSICVILCVPRSLESCFDSLKPLFQTCVSGFTQTSLPKNLMFHHKRPFQNSFSMAMCTCFDRCAHPKLSDKPRHGNEQQRAWHRWLPLLPHRPRAQGSQTDSCVKSSWNWRKPGLRSGGKLLW